MVSFLVLLWCMIYVCTPCIEYCKPNCIDVLTLLVAIISLSIAYYEYRCHKKDKKSEVLSKYSERYSNSEYIQLVVSYCIVKNPKKPTLAQKEMFLRFFEELEEMIELKYLDEKLVDDYFSYYFLLLWERDDSFFWRDGMLADGQTVSEFKTMPEWHLANKFYHRFKKNSNKYCFSDFIFAND